MRLESERMVGQTYYGLQNQGATCYLNSVLQCLYMTEDFRREVENFTKDTPNSDKKSVEVMQEMQNLFKNLKTANGTTEGITKCLHINNVYEQQDAVEYYQKTLKVIGPQMSKIFQGQMSNNTKCLQNHLFQEKCPFFTIPLSIDTEPNEVFNVKKGLETFSQMVKLDEDNLVYCDQCGQKAEADTWTEIEEFPTILTLYLKRFYFDYNQMKLVKNDCPTEINLQLQISNFTYELYAVINHIGGRSGGHYYAVIRSFEDNDWYCFNDSRVTQKQREEKNFYHSQLAYLLMYRKKVDVPHSEEKSTKSINMEFQREQCLIEATPSSAEDSKPWSVSPTPQTTEQSAEETQSSEIRKEVKKTENNTEESSPTGETEPSIHSPDKTEKPAQAYQEEEEKNEVEAERIPLTKAAQDETGKKRNGKTEEQEATQLAGDALGPAKKIELSTAEGDAEGDKVTSDLTQAQTDSGLGHKCDGGVLKVEQKRMDKEEDPKSGASEKPDLKDTSCESQPERNRHGRHPEDELQILSSENGAHTGTDELQCNSSDINRKKSPTLNKMIAQSTEQESEIQTLIYQNTAETVTSEKRKTCQCCTIS